MRIVKLYYSIKPKRKISFSYGGSGKRPSWIKLNVKKEPSFVKLNINNKHVMYDGFLPGYFIPMDASTKEYKEFYDEYAKNYHIVYKKNNPIIKELLKEFSKIPNNSSILDIGAGTGENDLELFKKGFNSIDLLDISPKMLDLAKKRLKNFNAHFYCTDLEKFVLKKKYDVILASLVLHYYSGEQLKKMLAKLKGLLKKGGLLITLNYNLIDLNNIFENVKNRKVWLKTIPFTITTASRIK
ncbi:MAG: class I SAM-dependent methyltransferase [Candidatus Nanoarchaeia archaeon]|jgi:ubiquinone/menaquinone biosynthesis C-methylase UbiE